MAKPPSGGPVRGSICSREGWQIGSPKPTAHSAVVVPSQPTTKKCLNQTTRGWESKASSLTWGKYWTVEAGTLGVGKPGTTEGESHHINGGCRA